MRQLVAILHFASSLARNLSGKSCEQDIVRDIIRQLIGLAATASDPALAESDIPAAVQAALAAAMGLLSAESFLGITKDILAEQDMKVCAEAPFADEQNTVMVLETFVQRLPSIRKEVRVASASILGEIIKKASALLASDGPLVRASLAGLRAVVTTAMPTEDNALAQSLPRLVDSVKVQKESSVLNEALSLLALAM